MCRRLYIDNPQMVKELGRDWLNNQSFKWFSPPIRLFAEDRPFWWIQENQAPAHMRMKLLQNDLTCEASPGSPSDHVTFFCAVLFVWSNWILKRYSSNQWTIWKAFLGCILWQFTFTIPMIVVLMSKMMSASNFLHQLIIGFLLGIFIGKSVATTTPSSFCYNLSKWCRNRLIMGMLLIDWAVYWIQKAMDIDPQWSVKLAFKWCDQVEYLKPEQIPTYALVQCFGIFVAMTISCPINLLPIGPWKKYRKRLGVPILAVILIVAHVMLNNVPREHGVWMFYLFTASTYSALYFALFNFDTTAQLEL